MLLFLICKSLPIFLYCFYSEVPEISLKKNLVTFFNPLQNSFLLKRKNNVNFCSGKL